MCAKMKSIPLMEVLRGLFLFKTCFCINYANEWCYLWNNTHNHIHQYMTFPYIYVFVRHGALCAPPPPLNIFSKECLWKPLSIFYIAFGVAIFIVCLTTVSKQKKSSMIPGFTKHLGCKLGYAVLGAMLFYKAKPFQLRRITPCAQACYIYCKTVHG